jgi:hypothetical protein
MTQLRRNIARQLADMEQKSRRPSDRRASDADGGGEDTERAAAPLRRVNGR